MIGRTYQHPSMGAWSGFGYANELVYFDEFLAKFR